MATETALRSLEYYAEYALEEGELELPTFLLDCDRLAEKIASGFYPTPALLIERQRSLGQGPRAPDALDEAPFPPRRLKSEIFDPDRFTAMDQYVKSLLPETRESYEDFAQRLFRVCRSNLDKVRAVFYFVCTANVAGMEQAEGESGIYTEVRNLRKPGGVSSVFLALVKLAGVPVQQITGFKKGTSYESGFHVPHDAGCWFACYVEGEWRFVDAFWGSQCVSGFDKGNFARLDGSGNLERAQRSEGTDVYECNEFYFLTDPVVFAMNHFPDEHLSDWQLLARPLTLAEFNRFPRYLSGARGDPLYRYQVTPKSHPLNVILAAPGTIQIALSETGSESYEYRTEIRIHTRSINEATRAAIKQLSDIKGYLSKMTRMSAKEVRFKFVPPCRGKFMLTIYVMRTERVEDKDRVMLVTTTDEFVSYVIHCPQAVGNARTLPEGSDKLVGFGAGRALAHAGLTTDNPGEMTAVDGEQRLVLDSADLRCHAVECVLTGSGNEAVPSNHALSWTYGSKTNVVFLSPDPGSYALVVQEEGKPLCQFLIDAPSEFRDCRIFRLPDMKGLGGLGAIDPRLGDVVDPVSHPDPYVVCEEDCLEMRFATKRRLEVKAELLWIDQSGRPADCPGFAFVNASELGFSVETRFPLPGHYVVRLLARHSGGQPWGQYANYFVRALGQLDGSAGRFPETGTGWQSGYRVLRPTCGLLPLGEAVPFTLQISDPDVQTVCLVNESTKERSVLSRDSDGLWQGSIVGTSASAGATVTVMAGPVEGAVKELLRYRFESPEDRESRRESMRQAAALNRERAIVEKARRRRQENQERAELGLEMLPESVDEPVTQVHDLEVDSGEPEVAAAPQQEPQGQKPQQEEPEAFPTTKFEERSALAAWLNKVLAGDPECRRFLPFRRDGFDVCSKCRDGLVPCKVINAVSPGTIDERVLSRGDNLSPSECLQNLTLALNSAQSLGVSVSVEAAELARPGSDEPMLDLLWQVIRQGLLAKVRKVASWSSELRSLAPEQILQQWVNSQLELAGSQRRVGNFSDDIRDSDVYAQLLQQIAAREKLGLPYQTQELLQQSDPLHRAQQLLRNAHRLGAADFVQAPSLASGNPLLNTAFVAGLYCKFASPPVTAAGAAATTAAAASLGASMARRVSVRPSKGPPADRIREETTYLNWINSMGVQPRVTCLYSDLRSGLVYFQLCDLIRPGIVRWSRVHKSFHQLKARFQQLENCNYALELGRELGFSLVGTGGEDLLSGNEVLTLGLLWQLMRAYTLAVLSKLAAAGRVDEKAIIQWANDTLRDGSKASRVASFQDPEIGDARAVLELIDCLRPGVVDYANVLPGDGEGERLQNAKLAISLGWRIGAKIYALPEDIVEVKPKMVMTVFACLMQLYYELK